MAGPIIGDTLIVEHVRMPSHANGRCETGIKSNNRNPPVGYSAITGCHEKTISASGMTSTAYALFAKIRWYLVPLPT